jgi:ribosomal protein S8
MHTLKNEVVICGDTNVNYLVANNRKTCLNSLLLSYNLSSIVNFLTRIQNNSISAIDNIFIDSSKLEMYILTSLANGLSDHEAQFLEIFYIDLESQNQQQQLIRKIDNHSMADFVMKLSYETWDTVLSNVDIDTKFNSFLNTYLRILYSSFPLKKRPKHSQK